MNRPVKIFIKIFFRIAAGCIGFVVLYFLFAFLFSAITVNDNFQEETLSDIEIYILSNGAHTDLVLPIRNRFKDWSDVIPFAHTISNDSAMKYIAFGWGDKNFYLETPTWGDLKFSTAFNALFFLSTSAMHVTLYKSISEHEYCRKIRISDEHYKKLVHYIESSFQRTGEGDFNLIKNFSYGNDDCFYDAKGTFSLFYTCNTWTNEGLKQSGLRASFWTPFEGPLRDLYIDN